jgi:hypothetical protein
VAIERSLAYPSIYDSDDVGFTLTSAIFSTPVSVGLPSTAPAGQYEMTFGFVYDNPTGGGHFLQYQLDGTIVGAILSTPISASAIDDNEIPISFVFQFAHPGGVTTHDFRMRLGSGSGNIAIITVNISIKRVA